MSPTSQTAARRTITVTGEKWGVLVSSRSFARVVVGVLTAVAVVAGLLPFRPAPALATGDPIKYIHDEAGRLVGVIDSDGSAARYSYDKVGNITAIDRFSATDVSIIEFTPNSAPGGSSVTIWGTGYSSTPGDNAVAFNGSAASVTSAGANKLVVTVPSGAGTGSITVTVGSSTATSLDPFTVGAGAGQPTITGFAPPAVIPGDQLTITGTNFDADGPSNLVKLGGGVRGGIVTATSTQLTVTVPEKIKAGKVSVTTPAGTATSTNDLYAAPPGFSGTVIQSAERMSIGDTKTVSVPTSSKVVMVVFDATQGQKISLVSDTSAQMSTAIYSPDGSTLTPPVYPAFPEPPTLTQTGTYTIIVDPRPYNRTGSVTLKLYSVPADVSGQIAVDGSAVTFSTTVPGQNAAFTFQGTQGQRLAFSGQLCHPFTIKKPDGTAFATGSSSNCTDLDLNPLPVTGTYTIYVDPNWSSVVNNMWMLLSSQVTGTITPGTPVSLNLSRSGQDAYLTFDGTAGQKMSLTNQPTTNMFTSIIKPDGSTLASPSYFFQEPKTLPVTGTYTVWVNPPDGHTGSTTIKLYDVPADVSGTIDLTASPIQATTSTPGQNASYTFDETQGHSLNLAGCISNWNLYKPSGGSLASGSSFGCTDVDFDSLPETGTYRLFLDPQGETLLNKTITVSEPLTGSMSIGGSSVTKSIGRSAQDARVTFDGTASQHVNVTVSGMSTQSEVRLLKPDGSSLASTVSSSTANLTNVTLPSTATYTVVLDPINGNTTSGTFSVVQTPGTVARRMPPAPNRAPVSSVPRPPIRSRSLARRQARNAPPFVTPPPKDFVTMRLRRQARRLSRAWQPRAAETWVPSHSDLHGNFRADREESPWTAFPPRRATRGATAVAGQVLRLNGKPLRNVTLEIGDVEARTDFAGRFLLRDVESGHEELGIDGASASKGKRTYGFFEAGIDIAEGRTNVLDYTIWMPRLDTAHEVRIPKRTTHETVVTTPKIPGLELRIPAGKTIEDRNGHVVHRVGITAIPVDRPPFPLPEGVEVPIYFTIQPGGAEIEPFDEAHPNGARLIYPNYTHAPAGTRVNFWNYEPEDEGWYVYGHGTVTDDAKQVVPDEGVSIYEFTGAMIANWPPGVPQPPGLGPIPGGIPDGDPVDLATGLFVMKKVDLYLPDTMPIALARTYRQADPAIRAFGVGMGLDYNMVLSTDSQYTYGELILPDGGRIRFNRTTPGSDVATAVFEAQATPTDFYKAHISWDGSRWNLVTRDGTTYVFGQDTPLLAIKDRFGNQVTIDRVPGAIGQIKQITSPNGRWIRPTYDSRNRIIKATDNTGRTVNYTYGTNDRLTSVQDARGDVTQYGWDSSNRMTTIKDPRQYTFLTNQYGAGDRVVQQTQADGTTYGFSYTTDNAGKVTQTNVTDPRGLARRVTFNAAGYTTSDVRAFGTADQNGFTYSLDAATNRVLSVTDELGRKTSFTYDANGNTTSITRLADTTDATTTTFTYDPTYGSTTGVTDALGHTSDFDYDGLGRLTSMTDPTGMVTSYGYNAAGQVTSVANGVQDETTFSYSDGDLVSTTDPLGRTTTRYVDGGGHVITTTDPAGNSTRFGYNAANLRTKITDPLGNVTSMGYDANGNLTSVTDAKGHVTAYTYNSMDRVATRTDPLSHTESYEYDADGNLTKFIDRRGKSTTYRYDNLNRRTFTGFDTTGSAPSLSYESTIDVTYDDGNRPVSVDDSVGGTILFNYDGFDNVTSQETPEGEVAYTYDAVNRRQTMTVPGESPVDYDYDAANRLTSIERDEYATAISYDEAGRRDAVTLPDGITEDYSYDAASELTSISYASLSDELGDLAYAYDSSGRRRQASGTFAGTILPAAVSSTSYNDANQLTQWGAKSLAYDLNGNLTSEGSTEYSYDARNQLSTISDGNGLVGEFHYDGLGRRVEKTVDSLTTKYLYDGQNAVQELSATGAVRANLLTGLAVDDIYSRSTATSMTSFLTDGLRSTIATADEDGVITSSYTYGPYGEASVTGSSNTDRQYAGRESDGTGLIYMRARYYSPQLARFTSGDPVGFGGGDTNLYAYVGGNPIDLVDPMGQSWWNPLDWADSIVDSVSSAADTLITAGRKLIEGAWDVARTVGSGIWSAAKSVGRCAMNFPVCAVDLEHLAAGLIIAGLGVAAGYALAVGICGATAGVGCLIAAGVAGFVIAAVHVVLAVKTVMDEYRLRRELFDYERYRRR